MVESMFAAMLSPHHHLVHFPRVSLPRIWKLCQQSVKSEFVVLQLESKKTSITNLSLKCVAEITDALGAVGGGFRCSQAAHL